MVDWHDPALMSREFLALTKLLHALAGLYIWETVLTAGFELKVLRGKKPYRWTIWLYLGTRYTTFLTFILFFVQNDSGGKVSCRPFIIANCALSYVSWGFASLIIVLRIIAIWNRNTVVSSIALSLWLVGLGISTRTLALIEPKYDPDLKTCVFLKTHNMISAAVTILAVDLMLLAIMLMGLLRHAHRSSTGIWYLLYKQCIVWMVLAAVAEIPPVVFLILNLNDAWNQMLFGVGITMMSIGAARMYRSLSKHGSLTEYSSDPPQFSAGLPLSNFQRREAHDVHSKIRFRAASTVTQPNGTMPEPVVFIQAERIQFESVPDASSSVLAVPAETKSKGMSDY
ncbi:hypothetical protein H4582DRAFT_1536206 [Lactarius indigo]|nr:hypothetical protein H4582DRAFT_1536206 [Lactarius indigo]